MDRALPHPGQLRHKVEIGRTVNAVNENGYPEKRDEILCRVWAAAEDDASRYTFAGQAETAERGLCFAIRWRGDVEPGMWVLWRGEKRTITKLGEYDFKRRYLKLTTVAPKAVGG
jgi:SPP1 family predicted phage head-tail adaptor